MRNAPLSFITYWMLQLAGWGSILTANLLLSGRMEVFGRTVYLRTLLYLILGISISHLMRISIRRSRLIEGSNIRFLIGMFSMTSAFAVLHASVEFIIIMLTGLRVDSDMTLDPLTFFLRQVYFFSFLYIGWSAIYSVVLLFRKSHALQLERMHQIRMQRELELKSIKSSINPPFHLQRSKQHPCTGLLGSRARDGGGYLPGEHPASSGSACTRSV